MSNRWLYSTRVWLITASDHTGLHTTTLDRISVCVAIMKASVRPPSVGHNSRCFNDRSMCASVSCTDLCPSRTMSHTIKRSHLYSQTIDAMLYSTPFFNPIKVMRRNLTPCSASANYVINLLGVLLICLLHALSGQMRWGAISQTAVPER